MNEDKRRRRLKHKGRSHNPSASICVYLWSPGSCSDICCRRCFSSCRRIPRLFSAFAVVDWPLFWLLWLPCPCRFPKAFLCDSAPLREMPLPPGARMCARHSSRWARHHPPEADATPVTFGGADNACFCLHLQLSSDFFRQAVALSCRC